MGSTLGHNLDNARRMLDGEDAGKAACLLKRLADRAPGNVEVLELLGEALLAAASPSAAIVPLKQVVDLGAASVRTFALLGDTYTQAGNYAAAIDSYREGLALEPGRADLHHHLGKALFRMGSIDHAVDHLRSAARFTEQLGPIVSLANIIPGAPAADGKTILRERLAFGRRLAPGGTSTEQRLTKEVVREPKRLRVGYLSAHFHSANYMKPVWALINNHDRERVEVHLFSDSPENAEWAGYRPGKADKVHHIRGVGNAPVAERVRALGVDVLVDLNAYSFPDRLGLYPLRPAPCVCAWFNMFATSGVEGIDYLIGDAHVVRRCEEKHYTEKIVRLPVSYLTFEVAHEAPPVAPAPCIRNGFVTFGSLISQYKITPQVLDAWAKILRGTQSRLLIGNTELGDRGNRTWLRAQFARRRVDPERVTLVGPAEHYEFLRYYDRIDVALDGFPYNGGTTTMEAIWQGVPVLTFRGDRWASRTSQSLLLRTHLGEYVARSPGAMVRQAMRLARAPDIAERLSRLRSEMRDRIRQSSICDGSALARAMEEALFRCSSQSRVNRPGSSG